MNVEIILAFTIISLSSLIFMSRNWSKTFNEILKELDNAQSQRGINQAKVDNLNKEMFRIAQENEVLKEQIDSYIAANQLLHNETRILLSENNRKEGEIKALKQQIGQNRRKTDQ